jgi:hypothetical protein
VSIFQNLRRSSFFLLEFVTICYNLLQFVNSCKFNLFEKVTNISRKSHVSQPLMHWTNHDNHSKYLSHKKWKNFWKFRSFLSQSISNRALSDVWTFSENLLITFSRKKSIWIKTFKVLHSTLTCELENQMELDSCTFEWQSSKHRQPESHQPEKQEQFQRSSDTETSISRKPWIFLEDFALLGEFNIVSSRLKLVFHTLNILDTRTISVLGQQF